MLQNAAIDVSAEPAWWLGRSLDPSRPGVTRVLVQHWAQAVQAACADLGTASVDVVPLPAELASEPS